MFQPGRLGDDRHVHSITAVSTSDEGSYGCVAENVLGQAQQVAYLAVSGHGGWGGGVALVVSLVWLTLVLVNTGVGCVISLL